MKFLRFSDLKARGIVRNRTTLSRWIHDCDFPPGVLLGPNTRVWPEDEINRWIESRAAKKDATKEASNSESAIQEKASRDEASLRPWDDSYSGGSPVDCALRGAAIIGKTGDD